MMRLLRVAGPVTALAFPVTFSAQQYPSQQYPNTPAGEHSLNHGEFAAYGDFFRVAPSGHSAVNFVGLGGRFGVNVHPHVALEAEMSYDFARNYTTIGSNGGTTTTVTSKIRPLTGLFGPKFQFGTSGPFRAFLAAKAGFIEFSRSYSGASTTTFSNSFDQFGGNSTHFAAYPGGGIEAFFGPIGIRAEAGDEIYLNDGAYHNLRVTFGPTIRF